MAIGTTVSKEGSALEVVRVPMFRDNYGWILRDLSSGNVAAVDPAEHNVIQEALEERCAVGLTLELSGEFCGELRRCP
jgi:selenophosphate synthetase-related protein